MRKEWIWIGLLCGFVIISIYLISQMTPDQLHQFYMSQLHSSLGGG